MPLIKANGVDLFYDITGPDDAPPVVFSNSLGTTLEMWDRQIPPLSRDYRCVRYDTRGHGRSPASDRPASIADLAGDMAGLMDGLGIERAHIVGLSLGGMTGQAFAAANPARVDRLVLMATSAHVPPPEGWRERATTVRDKGMKAITEAVLTRWFTPSFAERDAAAIANVRDRFLAIDPVGYAVCCQAISDMDLRGVIGAIKAPTLILAGADDPATPVAMSEDMRARIPESEMVVLPRAAHLLAIERPDIVNPQLRGFLDRAPAGGERHAGGGVSFEAGLANRKAVLGVEHVQRSLAKAGSFAMPWQDFITRTAWGEVWGDPRIPRKTRSFVTLAMMVALHREEEFKLHVRPALRNGVTVEELQSLLLQTAIYAGVPATNAAFRWAKDVLGDEID